MGVEVSGEELWHTPAVAGGHFAHLLLQHLCLCQAGRLGSVVEVGIGVDKPCTGLLVGEERPGDHAVTEGIGSLRRHVGSAGGPVVSAVFEQEAAGLVQDRSVFTLLGTVLSCTAHHSVAGYPRQDAGELVAHSLLYAQQVGRYAVNVVVDGLSAIGPGILSVSLSHLNVSIRDVEGHNAQFLSGCLRRQSRHQQARHSSVSRLE